MKKLDGLEHEVRVSVQSQTGEFHRIRISKPLPNTRSFSHIVSEILRLNTSYCFAAIFSSNRR